MKALDPIKKLSAMNEEKRKALNQAGKQLMQFLKTNMPKLKAKDPTMSTQDFASQYSILAEQVKRVATELSSTEQVEYALLREENFNNRIMR